MQYYHNLLVNKNKEDWMFYEWDDKDEYESLFKVPVVKVSKDKMMSIIDYHIRINNYKENSYDWILFVSSFEAIAIMFDKSGREINRSYLLLEEEDDIVSRFEKLESSNIEIEYLDKVIVKMDVRDDLESKKVLRDEIDKIIKNKDVEEAKYLYYEYCGKSENDYGVLIKQLKMAIDGNRNDLHKLTNIIKVFSK